MEIKIIQQKIFSVRGHNVILDFDIAELYEVETRSLKQAVKRNQDRFPEDFMFQLTQNEWENLRSQIVISRWGGARYVPAAFTEHGITMLASVLRSEKAVKMNIAIVRAFIALREMGMHYQELAVKIKELEKKYDKQFDDVYTALELLLKGKQHREDFENRTRIGYKQPDH